MVRLIYSCSPLPSPKLNLHIQNPNRQPLERSPNLQSARTPRSKHIPPASARRIVLDLVLASIQAATTQDTTPHVPTTGQALGPLVTIPVVPALIRVHLLIQARRGVALPVPALVLNLTVNYPTL
jgi:hypothetical protein